MSKHTPGPWRISSKPNSPRLRPKQIRKYFSVSPVDGPALAILEAGREDIQEANATLIAAAPDMLEALEDCDKAFIGWQLGQIPGRPEDILRLITKTRTAIAKAKGEV